MSYKGERGQRNKCIMLQKSGWLVGHKGAKNVGQQRVGCWCRSGMCNGMAAILWPSGEELTLKAADPIP